MRRTRLRVVMLMATVVTVGCTAAPPAPDTAATAPSGSTSGTTAGPEALPPPGEATVPPTTGAPLTEPTAAVPGRPLTAVPDTLLGRVWTTIPTTRPRIALTFDAGGDDAGVDAILATLQEKRVRKATFFLTGNWVQAYPEQAARIAAAGYLVGNHTRTHPDLTTLSDTAVRGEVRLGRLAVLAATGSDPKPWFRFPFGAYDTRTLGLVNDRGWVTLGWSVDTLGWQGTSGGQNVESVVRRVLDGLQKGEIVLMHVGAHPQDRSTLDADALATMIDEVRARGYRFLSPTAML